MVDHKLSRIIIANSNNDLPPAVDMIRRTAIDVDNNSIMIIIIITLPRQLHVAT